MNEISPLGISSMALNASFGLEYLLNGTVIIVDNSQKFLLHDKTKNLIENGIELCSMIEKGEQLKETISYSELRIWEFMQYMKRFFDTNELLKITEEAKEIKLKLNHVLNGECKHLEEKEVREMQDFFNYIGDPFLGLELKKINLRRRGCF